MASVSSDHETDRANEEPGVIVQRESFLFHHAMENDRLGNHYILVGTKTGVGRGVQVCIHKRTGHKRALKRLNKVSVSYESFHREISALRKLDHPNLLRLFESFEDEEAYYIITELSTKGDLFSYLAEGDSHRNLTEADMARLMKQILKCVNYCHTMKVVHCDIKPENILLEKGDTTFERLTLADFGLAQFFDSETRMHQLRGTPAYWAPEMFEYNYGPKCDLWSCGVVAFNLLTGQEPFVGKSPREICYQVYNRKDHFDLAAWKDRSKEGKSFVQSLLTFKEWKRPTAEEALKHPWFEAMQRVDMKPQPQPSMTPALQNLIEFSARQKLKQATYAYLVAHATYKSRKKVIDQIFRKVDANHDGLISRLEIENSLREKGELFSKEELTEIFDRVDIDKNNFINYWEFLAATTKASTMLSNENLKLAFEVFDKNKSGRISADEVKAIFCTPQLQNGNDTVLDESVVDAIIQQVDENGDGEISYDEFVNMMQENLLCNKRTSESVTSESDDTNSNCRQRRCPVLTVEE